MYINTTMHLDRSFLSYGIRLQFYYYLSTSMGFVPLTTCP